jgi:hypothetical protein
MFLYPHRQDILQACRKEGSLDPCTIHFHQAQLRYVSKLGVRVALVEPILTEAIVLVAVAVAVVLSAVVAVEEPVSSAVLVAVDLAVVDTQLLAGENLCGGCCS